MQCNIDARGKRVRLLGGLLLVVGGLVLATLAATETLDAWWVWVIAAAAIAGGGFAMVEGWAGWCAVRAMGLRTPI